MTLSQSRSLYLLIHAIYYSLFIFRLSADQLQIKSSDNGSCMWPYREATSWSSYTYLLFFQPFFILPLVGHNITVWTKIINDFQVVSRFCSNEATQRLVCLHRVSILSLFGLEVRSVINTFCGIWGILYDVTFQQVGAFFITESFSIDFCAIHSCDSSF